MKCRLCRKEVPRLVSSHILSEFLYQGMYDADHCFIGVSSDPDEGDRLFQKGLREKLLCQRCDNVVFAHYEKYAHRVLYGGEPRRIADDGKTLWLQGLDYTNLKLFFLSLLWRMSVSRNEFFGDVSLGPYENRLANMLLRATPGTWSEFGVFCVAPLSEDGKLVNLMLPPDCIRHHGRRIYRCLIGGLLYCFFVGKTPLPREIENRFLREDGSWVIRRVRPNQIGFLTDLCMVLREAIAARRRQGRSRV